MSVDSAQSTRAGAGSRLGFSLSRAWLFVPVLAGALLAAFAGFGPVAFFPLLAVTALLWSLFDFRVAFPVLVLLASFVDTQGGSLWIQLMVVYGWLGWCALLTVWRGAWRPWRTLPRRTRTAILVWTAICLLGGAIGWLVGNDKRYLMLELVGALWPAAIFLITQASDRRGLLYAGIALVLISLAHTAFGLTWFKIAHSRLGGVYFTTVPGFTVVGLWTVALLAPRPRWRWIALVLMVPLLTHQFFSFTRGYWLGILAGMAVATIIVWRQPGGVSGLSPRATLSVLGGLAAMVALTFAISTLFFGKEDVLQWAGRRFQSSFSVESGGETGSNIMRLAEYSLAIDAARESPWVGRGWGFLIVDQDPFTGRRFEQGVIHNYYVFLWLKLGVLGLLAFGWFVWRMLSEGLRWGKREREWMPRAWLIAAVSMLVQALVICLSNYSLNDFCTGIYLAFVWGVALGAGAMDRA
jgi:O-antigen ligase